VLMRWVGGGLGATGDRGAGDETTPVADDTVDCSAGNALPHAMQKRALGRRNGAPQ
jgi:hypothetical protein